MAGGLAEALDQVKVGQDPDEQRKEKTGGDQPADAQRVPEFLGGSEGLPFVPPQPDGEKSGDQRSAADDDPQAGAGRRDLTDLPPDQDQQEQEKKGKGHAHGIVHGLERRAVA